MTRGLIVLMVVGVMAVGGDPAAAQSARTARGRRRRRRSSPRRSRSRRCATNRPCSRRRPATSSSICCPSTHPITSGLFIKTAREGGLTGTTFHRVVRQGIVQGGDPLTRDPATRGRAGSGGLNLVAREGLTEKHTRGAVSAVIVPGRPDSGGTQFFICIVDQPSLDGQHTIFGRVREGLRVAQTISEGAADDTGVPLEPVTVTGVAIRDTPVEVPPPFSTEPVEALTQMTAVLETSLGDITIGFTPGQRARARPQLPAAGRARRLRRHDLAPRREGVRRADGHDVHAQDAAHRVAGAAHQPC